MFRMTITPFLSIASLIGSSVSFGAAFLCVISLALDEEMNQISQEIQNSVAFPVIWPFKFPREC